MERDGPACELPWDEPGWRNESVDVDDEALSTRGRVEEEDGGPADAAALLSLRYRAY